MEAEGLAVSLQDAILWLHAGPGGRVAKPNPLLQTYDAGMSLRNAIGERLSHKRKPYIICVTLFVDMERDEACTEGSQSKVLWGTEHVAERLVELAEEESSLLTPGLGY